MKLYNKKDSLKKATHEPEDDLLPEYDFSGARPNPYSSKNRIFVELTPEVAKVFKTSKDVNRTLKAIISTIPKEYSNIRSSGFAK